MIGAVGKTVVNKIAVGRGYTSVTAAKIKRHTLRGTLTKHTQSTS